MARRKNSSGDQEAMEVDEAEADVPEGGIRIGDIYIPPPPPPACTMDVTGPRLMIWQIENINFKSYAGKQVLGPFHKNFTAIVGPNGSGKSNVIDSMLFVFGYRAQKIRSKKIGVLIHNSDTHQHIEECTVSVYFQMIKDIDQDSFEVVPNSQFVVSRTARRDNSSYYCINERRVQFKEVSKLLRSYGIDLDHNRFLILQGEVEQIAMMKPKAQGEHDTGMLEFLEDIIGSNRFKQPIEMLNAQVEELNEARTEKLNRVKVVEKEKDDIEGAKNEAVEFLKLENEVALKQNILYQVHRNEAQRNLEETEVTRQKIMDQMKDVLSKLDELKAKRKEKEKEYNKLNEKHGKCAKAVDDLKEQFSGLERQDLQCSENLKHCKAKAKKLVKDLEKEEQNLKNLQVQAEKCESEIPELTAKKEKLEKEKVVEEKKLAEVMASLQEATKSYQEEKDKYEAQLIDLKKTVNETKAEMDIAQSELDIYVSGEKNEQNKLRNMIADLEKYTKNKQENERLLKEVQKRIPETRKDLENCRIKLSDVIKKEADVSNELRGQRQKLEEAKSAMLANRNRGKVIDALMQQKMCGILPGVFGRLGDLGAIDEKYDVAISTACGPLDNIVTDTMDTAQKCVEYLKKHNVGYATFIALDKMDRWLPFVHQRKRGPEGVPRLFDLVKVNDERVLPAFYFALRETLVADNLDQATRIGLQGQTRYRVVTVKGELIDLSGTMSGGGGRPSRGRMGQSVLDSDINPNDVDSMMKEMDEKARLASNLREMKSSLEDKITELEKEIKALEHSLKKYEMEYGLSSKLQQTLVTQTEEQKVKVKNAAPDKNKVASMEKNIEKAKKVYDKAFEAASKIEAKVQKIHALIMDITEGKVSSAQQKLVSLNNKIDGLSSSITKSTVAIKTAKRNTKKSEDKITSLKQEEEENKLFKEKLINEFKELETKGHEIINQKEEAIKVKDLCEEQKKAVAKEINALKAEENKLNSDNIEVKNKADVCATKIKEYQGKIKAANTQISQLKLQEIDKQPVQPLPSLSVEEIDEINVENVQYEMTVLRQKLASMKPNMAAIAAYRKKEAQYLERVAELDEVTTRRDTQRRHYDDLRKQRFNEFTDGFLIISAKLKEMYQMITLGGDAELELCDTLDPFEGIQFSVRPPKKSWKFISNLSGGEKTLSSLALVFALHYYKPTPFYVMDEIDAALDFKNVSIVGNYIKERTKNAQFIIISLRNNMFELCDRLVGIYKTYNCTKSVAINPNAICAAAAAAATAAEEVLQDLDNE